MNELTLAALAFLARTSIASTNHANQGTACESYNGNWASAPATNGLSVVDDGQHGINANAPAAQNPDDSFHNPYKIST
ncbi:hypothetical protein [Aestuariivirga litoralis]|uniref:hypothetical protein n=1 Tax=Aestuariivirga litoralis TaxID=2650924 RepID=UPI0018C50D85|nr:hypothetical protein [Aestuariivirga litoralis]MBG1232522.1 hypothetical protein [Aestuariivirga litoralis]